MDIHSTIPYPYVALDVIVYTLASLPRYIRILKELGDQNHSLLLVNTH